MKKNRILVGFNTLKLRTQLLLSAILLLGFVGCKKNSTNDLIGNNPKIEPSSSLNFTQQVAEATALVNIELNEMDSNDLCLFYSISQDVSLTDEEKVDSLNSISEFDNLIIALNNQLELIEGSDFNNLIQSSAEQDVFALQYGLTLGLGDILTNVPNDGCNGWRNGAKVCASQLALCIGSISVLCVGTGPGYPGCWYAGASVCSGYALVCGSNNDATYPQCSGVSFSHNPYWFNVFSETVNPNYSCN